MQRLSPCAVWWKTLIEIYFSKRPFLALKVTACVCLLITIYGRHVDCDQALWLETENLLLIRRRLAVIVVFVDIVA